MWLDGPISHLLLMRRCVARGESPPLLGRVVDVAGCCAARQIVFAPAGACSAPLAVSHRWGPAAPLAISHRWGPAAPLAILQVRCRRSMGSVIARVKVALRAQLDRQGKH
jgi:hypothetical protein